MIFLVNESLKCFMNISTDGIFHICESHFESCDLKPHGDTKRLREGAKPVALPNLESVSLDHCYVRTKQLDLHMVIACLFLINTYKVIKF